MVALNTAVADQLIKFKKDVDGLISKNSINKDEAIFQVLRKYITESKKIRFEGNGYGDEWVKEAAKRGLSNIKTTPKALDVLVNKDIVALLTRHNVMNEREIHARYEIQLETYTKRIQIESRVIGDLALNHIIPTAIRYQNFLLENVRGLKDVLASTDFKKCSATQVEMIKEISNHISVIKTHVDSMTEERKKANAITDARKQANAYCDKVKPFFDTIRYHVDKLELIIDDESWTLPKYRELLFIK
jgi:glutamine synthetase